MKCFLSFSDSKFKYAFTYACLHVQVLKIKRGRELEEGDMTKCENNVMHVTK